MKRFGTDPIKAQYKSMDSQCRAAVGAYFRDKEERLLDRGNIGEFYKYV